ncbi:MAG: phospholipase D family protein, partial [Gammaproteobacteria bacterium]|nr:phospholipase D family protein [Gammaproteobacteria bacterium]
MDEHQSLMFDDPESTVRRRTLNVVRANAESVAAFDLSYFAGYRSMKALTYTTSIPMIADLVAQQDFEDFECVFGHGGIVSREAASILSFQTVARERLSNAIIGVRGSGAASKSAIQQNIYQRVAEGEVRFFVVKDSIAHAKIYLLEGDGKRRVIVGSANLSERAFSGRQAETLVVFDDDDTAWNHYLAQYEAVRDAATSELKLAPADHETESVRIEET